MENFSINKQNVKILIIGLIIIILGYILMIGGGSDNPNEFNYDMFNFRRTVLSPIVIIAGFIVEIVGIMKRPKGKINE
ncbi:MAG: DUF3098 domain-containing protein [Bacteroidales bacterium]